MTRLLHSLNCTDALAYKQGQGPDLTRPDPLGWCSFPPQERAYVALALFHSIALHHPHCIKRLAQAHAAFVGVKRVSPPGMGLPPFLSHRLAVYQLFPVLSYGGEVCSPMGHMVRKLPVFWHKVQRWCTNCFACTPTDILAIEAGLPPLDLLLTYKKHLANLHMLGLHMRSTPPQPDWPPQCKPPSSTSTPRITGCPWQRTLAAASPSSGFSHAHGQTTRHTCPGTPSPTQ